MAANVSSNILYEDVFDIQDINPEGKSSPQFKNVSRIVARGVTYEMELVIDIQTELYPLKTKDKFTLALASTLDMSGKPDDGRYNQSGEATLLDKFDYGMHGKVFRYDLIGDHRVAVYVSYGGLLMKLVGDQRHLNNVEMDASIYCLIRKPEESS